MSAFSWMFLWRLTWDLKKHFQTEQKALWSYQGQFQFLFVSSLQKFMGFYGVLIFWAMICTIFAFPSIWWDATGNTKVCYYYSCLWIATLIFHSRFESSKTSCILRETATVLSRDSTNLQQSNVWKKSHFGMGKVMQIDLLWNFFFRHNFALWIVVFASNQ